MNKIDTSELNTTNPNGNVGTYCGVTVTWAQVNKALETLPSRFSRKEFEDALAHVGVAKGQERDFIRGLSQSLNQKGVLKFDHDEKVWVKLPPSETSQSYQEGVFVPEAMEPPDNVAQKPSIGGKLPSWFIRLVAITIWLVLIAFNARFGWEFGGQDTYIQCIVVALFVAIDFGRAIQIGSFIHFLNSGERLKAVFCLVIVLLLMPVSITSTMTLLSSNLMVAQDINSERKKQQMLAKADVAQYQRYLDEIDELHKAWKEECGNTRCGKKADEIQVRRTEVMKKAEELQQKIENDSEHLGVSNPGDVPMIVRITTTLEQLKLLFRDIKIAAPLYIAICIELLVFGMTAVTVWCKHEKKIN